MSTYIEHMWTESSGPFFLDLDQGSQVSNFVMADYFCMVKNVLSYLLELKWVLIVK